MPRRLTMFGLSLILSACIGARFEEGGGGDPRVPEGPPQAIGGEATGPVTVLATGLTDTAGWRYSAYPTNDGLCFQLELESGNEGAGSAMCGPFEEQPRALNQVGAGATGSNLGHVEGFARADVAEIWLHTVEGRRLPAQLIDLDQIGRDDRAFLVFVPLDVTPTELVATDRNGSEIGTADVSDAFGSGPAPPRPQPPETTSSDS